MTYYIDTDTIATVKFPAEINDYTKGWNMALDAIIENAPNVDAVKVIRCMNCKWWEPVAENTVRGYCHAMKHCHWSAGWEISIYRTTDSNFFCGSGENREVEE